MMVVLTLLDSWPNESEWRAAAAAGDCAGAAQEACDPCAGRGNECPGRDVRASSSSTPLLIRSTVLNIFAGKRCYREDPAVETNNMSYCRTSTVDDRACGAHRGLGRYGQQSRHERSTHEPEQVVVSPRVEHTDNWSTAKTRDSVHSCRPSSAQPQAMRQHPFNPPLTSLKANRNRILSKHQNRQYNPSCGSLRRR